MYCLQNMFVCRDSIFVPAALQIDVAQPTRSED